MNKKTNCVYVLFSIFLFNFFLSEHVIASNAKESETLHIAVAVPMSDSKAKKGLEILEPIKMYIENVNDKGGINGKKIKLLIFDDRNDEDIAIQKAEEIVRSKALLVLGHRSSNVCIAVGQYYKKNKIPAITSTATADLITKGNDWYFRVIISNSGQGRFLSYYIKNILKKDNVSVIYDEDEYGKSLVSAFEESSIPLNLIIDQKLHFQKKGISKKQLNDLFKTIAHQVKQSNVKTIFLAVHDVEAAPIIKFIKDNNLNIMIIGGASVGKETFWKRFLEYPEEKLSPGYYSDGIYAVTNFMYDTSNQQAQKFRSMFVEKYKKTPGTASATSYDMVKIAVEALKNAGLSGDLKADREKIRNYFASKNTLQNAYPGITGFIYFDKEGNAVKTTAPIGIFDRQKYISAPIQICEINNLRELAALKAKNKESQQGKQDNNLISVGNQLLRQTKVVYTGLELNSISDLDIDNNVCNLDFFLWFRFAGKINFQDIRFTNALEQIVLDSPSITKNSMIHFGSKYNYRLFRVQGKFKMNYTDSSLPYGKHQLGISLRHTSLSREYLIFATDVLSIDFSEDLRTKSILNQSWGWNLYESVFFQDTEQCNIYGNPDYLNNTSKKFINYSRFNSLFFIETNHFQIRRNIDKYFAQYILIISFVLYLFTLIFAKLIIRSKPLLFCKLFLTFLLLLSGEVIILNGLVDKVSQNFLEHVLLFIDILWWVVPAIYICKTIELFIWMPLEKKTNHEVPQLVRHCVYLIVYLIFFFCIIAFVFDQKVTSLLASTGVIAMIIGLAVQINISNIFSGIALAMEKPFTLDEWVKIGNFDEAKVVGMNWRTTQFQNRNKTIISIPNSEVANESIINFQQKNNIFELEIPLHVDSVHDPERVIKIVLDVLNSNPCVLKDYKFVCRFIGYTEWSGEYVAIMILQEYAKKNIHEGSIMLHIWKELHRAGIREAVNFSEVHMIKGKKKSGTKNTDMLSLVDGVDIFMELPEEAKSYLSQCLINRRYKPGEIIVKDGDIGDSLFIIAEGTVSVMINVGNDEYIESNRIGAGNYFGEMGLLTGAPRTANIVAISETIVCEITRADVESFMEKRPEIKTAFNERLTMWIKENENILNEHNTCKLKKKGSNIKYHKKVMNFFGVKAS
ncbi:membrane protein containing Mechanosensitive ion channel MscS [Candidatus Magnetomorum sp. HK-1]|nr:membrane protein containing Mechanosensitive ion channel MscS [Candidatus Magnetomorum sp. HK-1]